MVTRKDVAQHAGVSPATVSNVINNKDIVGDRMRGRVLESIEKLGYKPNMVARSLKTKETKQIALISNDISNPYYAQVALGMEEEARKSGYVVCMLNASADGDYADELLKRQFDGVILATDKLSVDKINTLAAMNVPVVFIGNEGYCDLDKRVTQAHLGTYDGACSLFTHLIHGGHRRIGFICPRILKDFEEPDFRLKAYKDILTANKIAFDPALIFIEGQSLEYSYDATSALIKTDDRPTAIFCGNDNLALAAISAIHDAGLRVPEDISVAGFDNVMTSRFFYPPLTTVDMPKYELGQTSMVLLLRKIKGETVDDIRLKTKLIIRKSTASVL